jgi:hypothetical protein
MLTVLQWSSCRYADSCAAEREAWADAGDAGHA